MGVPELTGRPPRTEVIIALHGGEDIFECLDSLHPLVRPTKAARIQAGQKAKKTSPDPEGKYLFEGVTVVDDASPDGIGDEVIKRYPWVRVIKVGKNVGFAEANNIGVRACPKGTEAIFCVNSDCVVCRSGLVPMFNSYLSSGSVGMVGVMTNNAGYGHAVEVTDSQLANLELFCRDFAHRDKEDADRSMVVAFATLIRKSLWDELKGMDPAFFPACWEDTDLAMRIQMARFRCVLSARAFVLHKCHRSLGRMKEPISTVMSRGEAYFRGKHADAIECGYASHLAGDRLEPVVFDPSKHPDVFRAEVRRRAPIADIGLSIICGDNPAIEDLCRSVEGVFSQKVAYLNNCEDPAAMRTLLERYGFEVFEGEFRDFAYARNQALSHMHTPWVMFLDSDDYLPLMSAVRILRAVMSAGPNVGGFSIPTQFPPHKGNVRVDRVCLVRRHEGTGFCYPIHENVVQSIQPGMIVTPVEGAQVVHLNYNDSHEGQIAKKLRDWPLLEHGIREFPDCPFSHWNLAMSLEDDHQYEKALEWLDKSIALSKPHTSTLRKCYVVKARALDRLGRADEAEASLRAGIALFPDDPELNYCLADRCLHSGRHAETLERLAAMNLGPSPHFHSYDIGILGPKRRLMHARALLGVNRYPEAIEEFRQLINERMPDAATLLFDAAAGRRDIVIAGETLAALGQFTGRSEPWCQARAHLAGLTGENQDGVLLDLVHRYPGEPGAYLVLARSLLGRGAHAQALPLAAKLSEMGVWEGAHMAGIVHARFNRLSKALEYHRRALELAPANEASQKEVAGLETAIANGAPDLAEDEE